MVLPRSVAPSAILRRSSTRFNLAVRDMTIRMGAIAVALLAALATIKFFA